MSLPVKPPLNLLVTLLCPNKACMKRVAVMEYFPWSTKSIPPRDITLIDGRTPRLKNGEKFVDKLVCTHCYTVFPPKSAAIPRHLVEAFNPTPNGDE